MNTPLLLAISARGVLRAVAFASVAAAQAPGPFDYTPTTPEVVLSTDFTIVQASGGPVPCFDGLFQFRNVTINNGVIVRGVGSHPMIWVVDNFTLNGRLSVNGGDGSRVNSLPPPTTIRGGVGGPAAGRGGDGHPQIGMRSFAGMAGNGPGNAPGVGGGGGLLLAQGLGPGSGGGGGAFGTIGDPYYTVLAGPGTSFVQQLGIGGYGGAGTSGAATRTLPAGGPGGSPFVDGDPDNDFFGYGFDVNAQRFVRGELPFLVGGSGGGGGGDSSALGPFQSQPFAQDLKGGGGGGGGGCLVIVATNRIVIGDFGSIDASGGHGGPGEISLAGSAGGGGGGSGGLVILAAGTEIVISVKGETYANGDYRFCVSADGGQGKGTVPKYPPAGPIPAGQGASYDATPVGGFGGLGIIELVTRPGTNADGTNTVLDDNVRLLQNGAPLTGATKQRFLAWRGWRNAAGVPVDDFGAPTNIGSNEGDMRPSPVLLPWL